MLFLSAGYGGCCVRIETESKSRVYVYNVYIYMDIIIFHIYIFNISLYRTFFISAFNLFLSLFSPSFSLFFPNLETWRDADGRHEGGRARPPVSSCIFIFSSRADKRKVPSSPRHPYIILVLFCIFFSSHFFSRFYYPRARSVATRTCVFHDDNYSLFFSFLSLFHYHLLIIIIIALHLPLTNCLTDARSIETQRSIPQILARFIRFVN